MRQRIDSWLGREGFIHTRTAKCSLFYEDDTGRAIIIDQGICEDTGLSYTEYTREQNFWMSSHRYLFRFLIDTLEDLKEARHQLQLLSRRMEDEPEELELGRSVADRSLTAIDPSPLESSFEDMFFDLYGRDSYDRILKEVAFPDVYGSERFYDYLVRTREHRVFIAIEQNGERYHHPRWTQAAGYKRQLLKQNSFIAYGYRLYRWSIGGMIDSENFAEDLRNYLGPKEDLLTLSSFKATRQLVLYEHQEDLLEKMASARREGKDTFLIVLPVGTGKTRILLEDMRRQPDALRYLILEPTRILCDQMQSLLDAEGFTGKILVKSYAWFLRHASDTPAGWYDYVVVDEAHHAVSNALKRALEHVKPKSLIGMTATDKRYDARRLEELFGEYDTHMSLKEAILKGILAPIRAYRIKSNLDLSSIRYNGKDYLQSDLQRQVIVPSRDQLIVDVLSRYFFHPPMDKQGIIFCVSIRHAESMAERLREAGFTARAVSGRERRSKSYIEEYQKGELQLLTTCSLLGEGWDSPRTSLIVMARPTMSKVLYTQQLGRGTRRHPGKEALYVLDVVDAYTARMNPWSIHSLLQVASYRPFGDLLELPGSALSTEQQVLIGGLYEYEQKIEQLDIFTFEAQYGSYLSLEQLARELFVSTGTIKAWLKKGYLVADVTIPFGSRQLHYFDPEGIGAIREARGLTVHDSTTLITDFDAFIEKGDYTFSYKIIFLLSVLSLCDEQGVCNLDELTGLYSSYYRSRLDEGLIVDRKGCPYTYGYLSDTSKMMRSILSNPFEKFERKRFMYHTRATGEQVREHPELKELNSISFSHSLFEHLMQDKNLERLRVKMREDLRTYYSKLGGAGSFRFPARYAPESLPVSVAAEPADS